MPKRKINLKPPCITACLSAGLDPSRISVTEAAQLLGVGQAIVRRHCRLGRIKATRAGGRGSFFMTSVAIDQFLANPPAYGPKVDENGKAINPRKRRREAMAPSASPASGP
jgi:excisionase family DNA binding protein